MAISAKLKTFELRTVNKHFYLKHWTAAQLKAELKEVHGDCLLPFKTIYYWIKFLTKAELQLETNPVLDVQLR